MGVDVDDARHQREALGVDDPPGVAADLAHRRDPAVLDRDIGPPRLGAQPVDDKRPADHQIVHRPSPSAEASGRRGQRPCPRRTGEHIFAPAASPVARTGSQFRRREVDTVAETDIEGALVAKAKRVLPGGTFGNLPGDVVIREGTRRPGVGRERARICRLPARLRADAGRPRPPRGDRRGAGADRPGHDLLRQQPLGHRARRGDRRGGAVRRAGALRLDRLGGGPLCDARRPRLPPARQDPQIRGRLSRHERLFADEPRARSGPATSRSRSPIRPASRRACATRC